MTANQVRRKAPTVDNGLGLDYSRAQGSEDDSRTRRTVSKQCSKGQPDNVGAQVNAPYLTRREWIRVMAYAVIRRVMRPGTETDPMQQSRAFHAMSH